MLHESDDYAFLVHPPTLLLLLLCWMAPGLGPGRIFEAGRLYYILTTFKILIKMSIKLSSTFSFIFLLDIMKAQYKQAEY
jgi:hypothetical protein